MVGNSSCLYAQGSAGYSFHAQQKQNRSVSIDARGSGDRHELDIGEEAQKSTGQIYVHNQMPVVNGQIFEYAIGHSKMRLDDALGYFERQFDTVSPGGGPISTASRFDFPDGGIVAGIQLGHVTTPDLLDRLRQFSASTELATLGNFHVVSAFSQDGTVFIDFMPARTVKLTGLLPHGPEDAAGEDVPGVRRPEHLQRVTTIEHGEGPAWSRTNVYRTADADAALAAFKREFNAAGWGSLAPPEAPVAHLSDGRGECFLGIAGHGGDGAVVVVYRTLSGSHKP